MVSDDERRDLASDDERRRVARRLREYASWDGEEDCLVDCADWGERVLNLLGCGDTEGECYKTLADLIDPDCDEGRYEGVHTARPVDQEALLALADEIEYGASSDDGEYHDLPATMVAAVARTQMGYARRIREALGMES